MTQPREAAIPTIDPETTLADLATSTPGASRVFHRHDLDFCCKGRISLRDAADAHGLQVEQLLEELRDEAGETDSFEDWRDRTQEELIEHILTAYHAAHRAEVPRLRRMAERIEHVHAGRPDCPSGLAALLETVEHEMEQHMQKEEQILFPALLSGHGRSMPQAIRVMEMEHDDHGQNLEKLRGLTHDYRAPEDACNTWKALYLGLHQLERDLMAHIHLENHLLFPRALA